MDSPRLLRRVHQLGDNVIDRIPAGLRRQWLSGSRLGQRGSVGADVTASVLAVAVNVNIEDVGEPGDSEGVRTGVIECRYVRRREERQVDRTIGEGKFASVGADYPRGNGDSRGHLIPQCLHHAGGAPKLADKASRDVWILCPLPVVMPGVDEVTGVGDGSPSNDERGEYSPGQRAKRRASCCLCHDGALQTGEIPADVLPEPVGQARQRRPPGIIELHRGKPALDLGHQVEHQAGLDRSGLSQRNQPRKRIDINTERVAAC